MDVEVISVVTAVCCHNPGLVVGLLLPTVFHSQTAVVVCAATFHDGRRRRRRGRETTRAGTP
jgi:hypothetical protein